MTLTAITTLVLALAPGGGSILGTIDRPAEVKAIVAVDRETGKAVAGTLDPATGKFTIAELKLDAPFDLKIDLKSGARLEGVDLSVPRSDFEEEQPLSEDDIKTITATMKTLQTFEDSVEFLAIRGNIQHAVVLVNKTRTKPFYGSKPGEIVWRAEVWRFEKPEETWVKRQDSLFTILYRERIRKTDYDAKSVTFDPAIGGLTPSKNSPEIVVGKITLPDSKPGVRFRSKDK